MARVVSLPITGGLALLAILATAAYWSKRDMSLMLVSEQAFFAQPWRLLTSTLLHADVFHLAFNVYWLWVFGALLEVELGVLRYGCLLLVFAAVSSSAQFATGVGGIGLSGIGYGLWGFLYAASRRSTRWHDVMDRKTTQLFAAWFFLCLGLTLLKVWSVANVAHGVGALAGLSSAVLLIPAEPPVHRLPRAAGLALLAGLSLASALGATRFRPYLNLDKDAGLEAGQVGYRALLAKRYAEGASELERAVRLSPGEASLWFNLGIAYHHLRRLPEARKAYARAAELEPQNQTYRQAASALPP